MVKVAAKESGASAQVKEFKKKRPWRDKVRKKAKKAAMKLNTDKATSDNIPMATPNESEKKKKKKKRKKKWREPVAETSEPAEESTPASAVDENKKRLDAGRFRYLNEQLYTMSGADAFDFFTTDPESFQCYHKGFADQVKKWPNHPLTHITKWLSAFPDGTHVADLGCGEAKIAKLLGNRLKVHSFDLVAVNEDVTACDMAKLPLTDESISVAVFCLSLMGTNVVDFIKEARRILKIGGSLKIAEVTSRFVGVKLFCEAICKLGFELKEQKPLTDYFTMMEFKKIEEVKNKRPFGLKLKPCVYKKR